MGSGRCAERQLWKWAATTSTRLYEALPESRGSAHLAGFSHCRRIRRNYNRISSARGGVWLPPLRSKQCPTRHTRNLTVVVNRSSKVQRYDSGGNGCRTCRSAAAKRLIEKESSNQRGEYNADLAESCHLGQPC